MTRRLTPEMGGRLVDAFRQLGTSACNRDQQLLSEQISLLMDVEALYERRRLQEGDSVQLSYDMNLKMLDAFAEIDKVARRLFDDL